MSVDVYHFKCPACGHRETRSEGIYLFSDLCYTMLQCPVCKEVKSVKLDELHYRQKDYPLCDKCQAKMVDWDKTCPECGEKMMVESWYSDTI